jgi:hypothetical protein
LVTAPTLGLDTTYFTKENDDGGYVMVTGVENSTPQNTAPFLYLDNNALPSY